MSETKKKKYNLNVEVKTVDGKLSLLNEFGKPVKANEVLGNALWLSQSSDPIGQANLGQYIYNSKKEVELDEKQVELCIKTIKGSKLASATVCTILNCLGVTGDSK